ncbi:hypothetical protein DFP72DRAFT_1053439 [Ephemerocybe angulata]|uniref:Uncharacterized protein n=1 Tax=Ephemerocybe angulata TaxID=980116 RepID=A0A8H6H9X3_9AGAR|nr:hypothetical protein DFP72DRAFT_1053439 [Tulosesus angulatus]
MHFSALAVDPPSSTRAGHTSHSAGSCYHHAAFRLVSREEPLGCMCGIDRLQMKSKVWYGFTNLARSVWGKQFGMQKLLPCFLGYIQDSQRGRRTLASLSWEDFGLDLGLIHEKTNLHIKASHPYRGHATGNAIFNSAMCLPRGAWFKATGFRQDERLNEMCTVVTAQRILLTQGSEADIGFRVNGIIIGHIIQSAPRAFASESSKLVWTGSLTTPNDCPHFPVPQPSACRPLASPPLPLLTSERASSDSTRMASQGNFEDSLNPWARVTLPPEDFPKLFEEFCFDPPNDVCPFGVPCPNTDVTGIGQQISIYVTRSSTVFDPFSHFDQILIMDRPPISDCARLYTIAEATLSLWPPRHGLFLLIAGFVSMLKSELTRGDGIFVIVTVASPPSLYLWCYSVVSIWNANYFPIDHSTRRKPANQSLEVKVLRLVSLGGLVVELVMICLLFIPKVKHINFPQTGCDDVYGTTTVLWFNVAWMIPLALQTTGMIVVYFAMYGIFRFWTRRQSYEIPSSSPECFFEDLKSGKSISTARRENIDLITWTERVLFDQYPHFMNRTFFVCIVTVAQFSAFPNFTDYFESKECFGILLMTFGLFRERPRRGTNRFRIFAIRVTVLLFFAGVWLARWWATILVPSGVDWTILFIACSTVSWSWSRFSTSNMKICLPVVTVLLALVATVANTWVISAGNPISLGFGHDSVVVDHVSASLFSVEMVPLITWITCWVATSAWPWKRTLTLRMLNKGLWKRGHFLKVFLIILGPHSLWIQASNDSNQSHPMGMAFGQIFALIVAAVTITTLVDEARAVKKEVWIAVLKSDVMSYEHVRMVDRLPVRADTV